MLKDKKIILKLMDDGIETEIYNLYTMEVIKLLMKGLTNTVNLSSNPCGINLEDMNLYIDMMISDLEDVKKLNNKKYDA